MTTEMIDGQGSLAWTGASSGPLGAQQGQGHLRIDQLHGLGLGELGKVTGEDCMLCSISHTYHVALVVSLSKKRRLPIVMVNTYPVECELHNSTVA